MKNGQTMMVFSNHDTPEIVQMKHRFNELVDRVRFTDDGKGSVYDLLEHDAGYERDGVHTQFKRLCDRHPEVRTLCTDYKFLGKGQKKTPVVDVKGWLRIRLALKNETGIQTRRVAADVMVPAMEGDNQAMMQRMMQQSLDTSRQIQVMAEANIQTQNMLQGMLGVVTNHEQRLGKLEARSPLQISLKSKVGELELLRKDFDTELTRQFTPAWEEAKARSPEEGKMFWTNLNGELKKINKCARANWTHKHYRQAVLHIWRTYGIDMSYVMRSAGVEMEKLSG
jgi:hypothetical protein